MTSDFTTDASNIKEWLARIAPPNTPAEAIDLSHALGDLTIDLDPMRSAAVLAGLMTESRFQAIISVSIFYYGLFSPEG